MVLVRYLLDTCCNAIQHRNNLVISVYIRESFPKIMQLLVKVAALIRDFINPHSIICLYIDLWEY